METLFAHCDEDGDGKIDQWSKWQNASETYSIIKGFSKQVDRKPAKVSFSDLPTGKGFQVEIKLIAGEDDTVLPKIDQLIATFEG